MPPGTGSQNPARPAWLHFSQTPLQRASQQTESVQKAETGVKLNESVRRRLEEIRTGVQRAATMMTNIAEGAVEQEKELAEVTAAMSQIGTLTQRTAANAEESASAAAELSAQAGEMHELATQFIVSDRREPVTQASASTARRKVVVPAERGAEREKPAAPKKPRAKAAAAAGRATTRSARAVEPNDDVFPMSAAATIPFDDEDGDDVLGQF